MLLYSYTFEGSILESKSRTKISVEVYLSSYKQLKKRSFYSYLAS